MLVYSIDRQIQQIANQISFNAAHIAEKKEQINRLKRALSTIGSTKREFIRQSVQSLQPEHTMKTLHGDHEKEIFAIQENYLKVEFIAIGNIQLTNAEKKITQRINDLDSEILSLHSANASHQSRQRALHVERAEAVRKDAERN